MPPTFLPHPNNIEVSLSEAYFTALLSNFKFSSPYSPHCNFCKNFKAGEAIASSESLKKLNLSFLVNVSDATIVAIAESCKNLDALNLTSCEFVTGEGVRTLKKHRSLKELILTSCEKFSGYDLEELVLGCQMLEYIMVDRRLRMWVPMEVQDIIMREHCWID
ncbi:putative F-box/LRR-repeat protein 4-like isoform X7 [Capsicum annuum]|nr:putative F-box/LRR-repeat protein 4-like isoform X7 [Capsicum annuum]